MVKILILYLLFLPAACASLHSSKDNGDVLLIEYKVTGGMDIYQDGDKYGYALYIYRSGYSKINDIIIQNDEGERKTIEEPSNHYMLSDELLASSLQFISDQNLIQELVDLSEKAETVQLIREPSETIYLKVHNSSHDLDESEIRLTTGAIQNNGMNKVQQLAEHFRDIANLVQNKGVNQAISIK